MFDIFVSYAREDIANARELVSVFKAQGWSVFWDRRIPAGKSWRTYIGKALQDARCVTVLWTQTSIHSQWVIDEAEEGNRRNILVPILLEDVIPPFGLRQIQAADLKDWKSGTSNTELDQLIHDLADLLGNPNVGALRSSSGEIAPMPAQPSGTSTISVSPPRVDFEASKSSQNDSRNDLSSWKFASDFYRTEEAKTESISGNSLSKFEIMRIRIYVFATDTFLPLIKKWRVTEIIVTAVLILVLVPRVLNLFWPPELGKQPVKLGEQSGNVIELAGPTERINKAIKDLDLIFLGERPASEPHGGGLDGYGK